MKTPAHLMAAMVAMTLALPPGRRAGGHLRRKPKAVDKWKRAKRRQARASRKRNRR